MLGYGMGLAVTCLRMYLLPTRPNPLPDNVRSVPAW
jgi:hypothetical protein